MTTTNELLREALADGLKFLEAACEVIENYNGNADDAKDYIENARALLAEPQAEPGKWVLREVLFDDDGQPLSHREPQAEQRPGGELETFEEAVRDGLIAACIYDPATHDNDPLKAVSDLIGWNVTIALDPQVSSDAQALIDRGKAEALKAIEKLYDSPGPAAIVNGGMGGIEWLSDPLPDDAPLYGVPQPVAEKAEPVAKVQRGGIPAFGKATVLLSWEPGAEYLMDGVHYLYAAPQGETK